MRSTPGLEIRTRSVPTAGHLLALGFEPLGILTHPSGTKTFRFSPNAREALERFLFAKQRLDALLEGAEPTARADGRPAKATCSRPESPAQKASLHTSTTTPQERRHT
jgi:hypothetical protein